jgi:hypothetical protein
MDVRRFGMSRHVAQTLCGTASFGRVHRAWAMRRSKASPYSATFGPAAALPASFLGETAEATDQQQ